MMIHEYVTQPENQIDYLQLFRRAIEVAEFDHLSAAVAYATMGGVSKLTSVFVERHGAAWKAMQKRWLVGIDWCRTEPLALDALVELPNSTVKIPDGQKIVGRRCCTPILPFHPKVFWFKGPTAVAVISGSGNLSRNGLTRGHECGSLLLLREPLTSEEREVRRHVDAVTAWFERLWKGATLARTIRTGYSDRFNDAETFRNPAPTDDDTATTDRTAVSTTRRRAIPPERLRQLRAARHLWIDAGNLHKNRGPAKPGNQLMMSPMTRVFFGFDAVDVPINTAIGDVAVQYGNIVRPDCSLRFSDNSMDVLTLPVPDAGGPAKYDQETLLFEKRADGTFLLTLGTARQRAAWRRRSEQRGALVNMQSGRQWGVF